jgi:hypothetical protein
VRVGVVVRMRMMGVAVGMLVVRMVFVRMLVVVLVGAVLVVVGMSVAVVV